MGRVIAIATLALGLLCGPAWGPGHTAQAAEVLVSAAASLREALQDAGQAYQAQHPDRKVSFNFAASGALASQIEQGAPVDVFASANQFHMDRLEKKGLILPQTRRDFTANAMVIIEPPAAAPLGRAEDLTGSGIKRVAIGDPATVPAGQYAKQALVKLGLWEKLQGKLVLAADVRQVREYVQRGEVEAGVVFASDVVPAVRVAVRLAGDMHDPIRYPAAVLKSSAHPQEAEEFLVFLTSSTGCGILAKRGFQSLP